MRARIPSIGGTATLRRVAVVSSFPPIARRTARVLILGSMPGERSLAAAQYYAHPGNAFWPILSAFCGVAADASYARRTRALSARGIALWDVLRRCERRGSLDAAIDRRRSEPNDFVAFLAAHRRITTVLCNGTTAHDLFVRRVVPGLDPDRPLHVARLPSTSPAHASLRLADKQRQWSTALHTALRTP
jgi:hypoxanthine-DNA glycosylase